MEDKKELAISQEAVDEDEDQGKMVKAGKSLLVDGEAK